LIDAIRASIFPNAMALRFTTLAIVGASLRRWVSVDFGQFS
jgi:hypothetical protein